MALSPAQLWLQFKLLMWKNFVVQWRRGVASNFFLFFLPIFPPIVFVIFRELVDPIPQCFQSCRDHNAHQLTTEFNFINKSRMIAFYPDTPVIRRLMETTRCLSTGLHVKYPSRHNATSFPGEPLFIEGFKDRRLMEELVISNESRYLAAIEFELADNTSTVLDPHMAYSLRLPNKASDRKRGGKYSWYTDRIFPVTQLNGLFHYIDYRSNFVPLQYLVDQAIIRLQVERNTTCPLNPSCATDDFQDATTLCRVNGSDASENFTATCLFNETSQLAVDCQNSSSPSFQCNCSREYSNATSSGLGLYSAGCSCGATMVTDVKCISTARTTTSCCGRCPGSTAPKSFIPVMFKTFPFPRFELDILLILFSTLYSLVVTMATMPVVISACLELVVEKSTRLRETMKMMGLRMWLYYLTHFLRIFIILFPLSFVADASLKAIMFDDTDRGVIFLVHFMFVLQTIAYCFFLSSIISNPKSVSSAAGILWYLTYVPFTIAGPNYGDASRGTKFIMAMFPLSSMSSFATLIGNLKTNGEALTRATLNKPPTVDDTFRYSDIIGAQFLCVIFLVFITWYKENVFPGEFGVPKVWYFPFTRAYWFGVPPPSDEEQRLLSDVDPDKNEPYPTGLKAGISIRSLRKVFHTNNGDKLAVDGLNLNMYSDQITVLLGHNGAGKTTTMSMLVGLYPPTNGDAVINGHSVAMDIEGVRQSIGLCPQHNVLYDVLTVSEHLDFFLKLKQGHADSSDINEMMVDLQLSDKRGWKSSELSGGMKRKLSVGIALIGRPKVVILDEPTAGMDPYARRATWDLLGKYKPGCTMLLTTHLMDEADLLGDRIAIMSKGRVVCSGSSLFLKSKFGIGYHMTLVKDHEQQCDEDTISRTVLSIVPGSRLVGNAGAELAYVLPHESSEHFSKLFSTLEKSQKELGILSYGVSVTKLEEVFLKVGEEEGIVSNKKLQQYEQRKAAIEKDAERAHINLRKKESTQTGVELAELGGSPPAAATKEETIDEIAAETSDNQTSKEGTAEKNKQAAAAHANSASEAAEHRPALEMLNAKYELLQGRALWIHQYKAMVIKRFLNAKRSYAYNAITFILPIWFTSLAFISLVTSPSSKQDASLKFNYTRLNPQETILADFRTAAEKAQLPLVDSAASRDYLTQTFNSRIRNYSMSALTLRGGESDCCASADFIFNTACIANRYTNKTIRDNTYEKCPKTFGYGQCKSCLEKLDSLEGFSGECGFGCPAQPTYTSAERYSMFFQKRVLQDANVGRFFREIPTGVSMHSVAVNPYDLPDNERTSTYVARNVSCTNRTVEDYSNESCVDIVHQPLNYRRDYDVDQTNVYARVWSSAKSYHNYPTSMNVFSNMHLKSMMQLQQRSYRDFFISTSNFPLPPSVEEQVEQAGNSVGAFVFTVLSLFGLGFLSASFAVSPVEEVSNKAKHIQRLSGVEPTVFWLSNFTWDYCFYMLPTFALLIVFAVFNVAAYQGEGLGAVFVLLLFFGWSAIPLVYWISFLFTVPSKAFKTTGFIATLVPMLFMITNFVLLFPGIDEKDIADSLRYVFFLMPHYCFAQGIADIYTINEQKIVCDKFPENTNGRGLTRSQCYTRFNIKTNLYDIEQPGIGSELLYMFFMGLFFAAMTYVTEIGLFSTMVARFKKRKIADIIARSGNTDENEDEDVKRERDNVHENVDELVKKEAVVLHDLTKIYNPLLGRPAADNLCLTIPHGECFGLCGVNGAGKTTTFNMMTGDVPATSGTVYLQGHDISTHLEDVQRNIGYCPQFDALMERLTSRELLQLYCRLRGIPEDHIQPTVENIISEMHLTDWADKTCGTYSGGNKRKLSVAVALVGNPPILFLDEPTAGMDPGARRFLWDVMSDILASGRCIVLTSHSMEECEALCTRLAIMVNGRFKCLGSIQHLKGKFGSGYSMSMKVAHKKKRNAAADGDDDAASAADKLSNAEDVDRVDESSRPPAGPPSTEEAEKFMQEKFPGAELLESRQGQLHYNINIPGLEWSTIFHEVESHKEQLNIIDYSVTQATLEEVFVNFASAQFDAADAPPPEDKKTKKKKKN